MSIDEDLTYVFPDSVAVATQDAYQSQTGGYGQSHYSGYYQPSVDQWPQYGHSGSSSQGDLYTGSTMLGTQAVLPIPISSKDTFSSETLRNRVLTIREQLRSATGETTRADPLPTRSTR